jgi:pyruvate ferredoxin oxidoreductase gamma subunit
MSEVMEIRWHGRGGQGTVTAAKVLADACLSGGRYVQAFPEYGPERAGAPLRAFNRIGTKELRIHCPVLHPKVVSIVDATLLDAINVAEGAVKDTIFVVNTTHDPKEVRKKLGASKGQKVFTLVSGLVGLDHLLDDVKKSFGKKFSQKIIDGNLEAVRRGFGEVKEG